MYGRSTSAKADDQPQCHTRFASGAPTAPKTRSTYGGIIMGALISSRGLRRLKMIWRPMTSASRTSRQPKWPSRPCCKPSTCSAAGHTQRPLSSAHHLRMAVLLCWAILGRGEHQAMLHLSAAWGGLPKLICAKVDISHRTQFVTHLKFTSKFWPTPDSG